MQPNLSAMRPGTGCIFLLALILFAVTPALAAQRISGVVMDPQGKAVSKAEVTLLSSHQVTVSATESSVDGRFEFANVQPGNYLLRVRAPGFAERRLAISVPQRNPLLEVRLSVAPVQEQVTVTANGGQAEEQNAVVQPVNVISNAQLQMRAKAVTAQAVSEEPGLALQRTSPTIAGVFVRGLTGNKVNVFVDGVRFSTSAARGGINTFLGLVDSSALDAVEVLRGPNSAEFGSDAIGGAVQFLTPAPALGHDRPVLRSTSSTWSSTADRSFGSNLQLSYGSQDFGAVLTLAGRRVNPLRPGGGIDSHSAFTRFFGLPSTMFVSERLPGTGFTQYGGTARASWSVGGNSQFTAYYARNQQDGGRRWDQLLGGDGNLVAELSNLKLDLAYLRWDQQHLGWFDHASAVYSLNSQREERINQGGSGDPMALIRHEPERTTANGIQTHASKYLGRHSILLGAEFYHERLRSPAFAFDPATGGTAPSRPRVPDKARYLTGGVFAQESFEAVPGRLRLVGAVRFSAASYRARSADAPVIGGEPLWADDSLFAANVSFRGGVVGTVADGLTVSGSISRGFRAPHMTDLGTLGLTGSGFEVAVPELAGLSATIGTSAAPDAVSSGKPVTQVEPETSMNYEAGARYRGRFLATSFAAFLNDFYGNIEKYALILPPGAVGTTLGGHQVIEQSPTGAVFVAASAAPVLVRANLDDARIYGLEHDLTLRAAQNWELGTVFTYVYARDRRTGAPPNLEGGTPATNGWLRIRYSEVKGRWWLEPYLQAAARQSRISSLALSDRRVGAMRSAASIARFFHNGATALGLVSPGADSLAGTADDQLRATGETLSQIQARVLGPGGSPSPLFSAVPGYAVFGLRGGIRIGERHSIFADFENLADRNYRGVSWGIDAPGRNLSLRYTVSF